LATRNIFARDQTTIKQIRKHWELYKNCRATIACALMCINGIPIGCGQAGAAMKRVKRTAAFAAALVATAAVAHAEDGDAAAGHAFARNACQPCHAVEVEQRKATMVHPPGRGYR
jgi:mono/diheme cytochrome c family protein